ncbi:MAG: hypothetical protein ABIU29_02275 [Chthoniobacterales bacterium]
MPCKAKDEATWTTIGEFFPLLEYGIGSYTLPPDHAGARAVSRTSAFACFSSCSSSSAPPTSFTSPRPILSAAQRRQARRPPYNDPRHCEL